ncbi:MAG: DegT/DnrJ/EryC1/StrS family aminotransferase [Candidatus Abyssobacteria bacterium SURF_5]|uniref:DegT/DnrJ/EryC1/StrS family aminotransferase n=1 Tax=Abyssobacteria bacterium (strain SURF_5) TaxID=2093360 RepID=A0A3A4NUF6_ABYX5|nr:MAG: DegT/DnrJ/EryC1/StrS family aminotransferase [Candidatus Abyssubacteria bacterium SURF_5]
MKVPVLDLRPQIQAHHDEIMEAIDAVIESGHFVLGPQVTELEQAICRYTGAKHAIGVASGSDALLVALMALGIGPNDAVITTPYTFFATVGAISRLGARTVFMDIRPDTFNINIERAADYLRNRCARDDSTGLPRDRETGKIVRVILPVHLFGQCADMEALMPLAREHSLAVVEDAAQALGARCNGRSAGAIGDIGCLSFYPTKNLGGFGDGGMITASDDRLAELCRIIRAHGSKPKYYHAMVGVNSRLDTIQAAVLLVGLRHLDEWADMRRAQAQAYFQSLGQANGIKLPEALPGQHHVFNQFVIRTRSRDSLRKYLAEKGISTEIYYPLPLHLQQCFKDLGYRKGDFPEAEKAANESLAIPIFPYLTDEQRTVVVDAIRQFQQQE